MSRLSYDTAWTLIYDPVAGNRTAMRSALYSLGFRQIDLVPTLGAFADAVANRAPDLALCEAHGSEEELCNLIQELRQGTTGYNPFLVIIVTAWEKSRALATRVINSGADDLLLRPFAPALLDQRIRSHVERRKGFVITSDYVGPDRRKDTARPSNVQLFHPPNSLKMKALDGLSPQEADRRLEAELAPARRALIAEKLRRDAFQVGVLWRLLEKQVAGTSRYEVDLGRFVTLASGISLRCSAPEFAPAKQWCNAILAALEALQLEIDVDADVAMLGHAAINLNVFAQPEKSRADQLSQIDATVALILARNQTALAG